MTLLTLFLSLTKNEHHVSHTSLLVGMKITDIICLYIIIDINMHIQNKAHPNFMLVLPTLPECGVHQAVPHD